MKHFAVVFLGLLLAPCLALALDPGVRIKDGFYDIDVTTRSVPFVGDYDCDGNKDLIVGETVPSGTDYGKVRLYLNTNIDPNPMFNGWSYIEYMSGGNPIDIYLAGSS
jgi:hypothetical protein